MFAALPHPRRVSSSFRFFSFVDLDMAMQNTNTIRAARVAKANNTHSTQHKTDDALTYGQSSMQGHRASMEDASFCSLQAHNATYGLFSIFDGHSGNYSANYAANTISHALSEALVQHSTIQASMAPTFSTLDHSLLNDDQVASSGTCAIVSVIERDPVTHRPIEITVANCGDSRAIVGRHNLPTLQLSVDHTPGHPVERQRIEQAGGKVLNVTYNVAGSSGETATDRINGGLAVSRGLGDQKYKSNTLLPPEEQLVSSQPDVQCHTINQAEDDFLILACDGVWDVMNNEEVVDFVRSELKIANKQCLRILAENFGSLPIDIVTSRDVNQYEVGSYVDFPKSRDKIKGYLMKTVADDGGGNEKDTTTTVKRPGQLYVRPSPPEAWEGSVEGEANKNRVAKAWPCGIVSENVIDRCLELGSTDNLSVVIVLLSDRISKQYEGHDGSTIDTIQNNNQGIPNSSARWSKRRNQ